MHQQSLVLFFWRKGIIQSMSKKRNCLDNSPMGYFFGKMKNEMFYGYEYTFNTLEELKKEMEEYISYYNNQRIIEKIKRINFCRVQKSILNDRLGIR